MSEVKDTHKPLLKLMHLFSLIVINSDVVSFSIPFLCIFLPYVRSRAPIISLSSCNIWQRLGFSRDSSLPGEGPYLWSSLHKEEVSSPSYTFLGTTGYDEALACVCISDD